MDMTTPIPQTQIEDDMLRVNRRLEAVTQKLAKRALQAATAEHAYKVAYAKAFLTARAEGEPVGACEQKATAECGPLLLERYTATALLEAAKEAGRNARAEADSLRSLNTNHRALVVGS